MISIFWAPPWEYTTDEQYDYLKEAHIDLIPCIHPSITPHDRSDEWPTDVDNTTERVSMQRKILDLALARDMKVLVSDPRIYTDVQSVVDDYSEHPALWGYFLRDEPARKEFSKYGKIYKEFLELDANHTPFVNLLPAGGERARHGIAWDKFIKEWITEVGPKKLRNLVFDNYPFCDLDFDDLYIGRGRSHGHIQNYFDDLEIMRKIGLEYDIPTGLYLQSVGIKNYLRRPDENDIRWNIYTALAYGIKSFEWFTWWTPSPDEFSDAVIDKNGNKTDLYDIVKWANYQIKSLSRITEELDAIEVYHFGEIPEGLPALPEDYFVTPLRDVPVLISKFKHKMNGNTYLMIVNKSNRSLEKRVVDMELKNPIKIDFKFSSEINSLRKYSIEKKAFIDANEQFKDSVLKDTFLPGEGYLFELL